MSKQVRWGCSISDRFADEAPLHHAGTRWYQLRILFGGYLTLYCTNFLNLKKKMDIVFHVQNMEKIWKEFFAQNFQKCGSFFTVPIWEQCAN